MANFSRGGFRREAEITVDVASCTNAVMTTQNVTIRGAQVGGTITVSCDQLDTTNRVMLIGAQITAVDTITLAFWNNHSGALTPGNKKFRFLFH